MKAVGWMHIAESSAAARPQQRGSAGQQSSGGLTATAADG